MEFKVKKISYFYNDNDIILQNITIAAKKGDSLSISGLNGSGKTTLLKLLSGFIKPIKGTITYCGKSIYTKGYREIMAYIPAEPCVFEGLTGIEHEGICIDLWNLDEIEYNSEYMEICRILNVTKHLNKKMSECSLGTKYKVYLALMLARRPKILFMDEPFSSMDEDSRKAVILYLKKIIPRTIIFFASHSDEIIKELANCRYKIENGVLYEEI